MTKDEFKHQLDGFDLDPRFRAMVMRVIDEANEVNDELIDLVADLLRFHADMDESKAALYAKEAAFIESMVKELDTVSQDL